MESTVKNFPQCDHLRSITAPYVFASEQAELIHINEQLASLDRHISELNTLRSTLHRRSSKLHNLLSPIHAFPIEVLSYIFQLVVDPKSYSPTFDYYRDYLRQALVLSSVSSHFRHIAFGTPELWDRIPLRIAKHKAIDKVSSLLQHCIARAQNVAISVSDGRREYDGGGNICPVIETPLTFDITRKVKAFILHYSNHASTWISKLNGSSFPMIETLLITCGELPACDFKTLNTMARLGLYGTTLKSPIIVPPSVQYLEIDRVSQKLFVSLLYQCPNLVEFSASTTRELNGPSFTKPLILNDLTRLRTGAINAITMSSSFQHLQLPSLESLNIDHFTERPSLNIVPFCCNVSATLTSLTIKTRSGTLDYNDLYELCRFTFPKLRDLKLISMFTAPLMSIIHSLSPLDNESNNPRPLNLPALMSISLYSQVFGVTPRILLDLLKNWWSDEALHLHLEFDSYSYTQHKYWTRGLREELKSIVGRRQIEITWGRNKL